MMRRFRIPLFAWVLAVWVAGILLLDPLGLAGCAVPQRVGRRGTFRLEVCDAGHEGPRTVAYRVAERATGDTYLLHWGGEERFLPGDAVEVAGVRFAMAGEPSAYDVYLLRHGVRGRMYAERLVAPVGRAERPATASGLVRALRRGAWRVRSGLMARLRASGLSEAPLAMARGVLLGDTSGLGEAERVDLRSAGMSHLMAVSGLHVGLLFALVMGLLRPLRWAGCGGGSVRVAALAAAWAYVVLVGCPASAVRAAVMLSAVVVAWLRRGVAWGWHDLCVAAFLILVADPQQLYDVGFQLSFLAVAGILAFAPAWRDASPRRPSSPWLADAPELPDALSARDWALLRRRAGVHAAFWARRGLREVRRLVVFTLAAQLLTFPVVAYVYHQVPLLGWVQGVVVAPLLPLYVMGLLLLAAFPGATWAVAATEAGTRWMLAVAHAARVAEEWMLGGRLRWHPSAPEAALMLAGVVACLVAWRARRPWLWLAVLAGVAAWGCLGALG